MTTIRTLDLQQAALEFVDKYVKNQEEALAWAVKSIDKSMYRELRPHIRAALKERGYRFGE